jgi:hypothetical protein
MGGPASRILAGIASKWCRRHDVGRSSWFCSTKRLAAKLPPELFSDAAPPAFDAEHAPIGEWHGHLLILDRRQCVMFCHDLTRYVLFLPGLRAPQFSDLGRWHRELFLATLATQGIPSRALTHLDSSPGPCHSDARTDPSVLGSLRVAADDLQYGSLPRVPNVLDLDPVAISHELNQRPCQVRKRWIRPDEAMRNLIEEVTSLPACEGTGCTSVLPKLSLIRHQFTSLAKCQRSSNNPQVWSLNSPHPLPEGG